VTLWDCIMLRDELDMLECRLIEMKDHDVMHVIVEATANHRGVPKPLYYAENQERFVSWKDRIRYVSVVPGPEVGYWAREHWQRDMAWVALDPELEDLVLIADLDEIPSRAVLEAEPATGALVMQHCACFAVDWMWPNLEPTGVLIRAPVLDRRSLAQVRDQRGNYPAIVDGGWHLSWMGGHEAHLTKLAAHCHEEQDEMPGVMDTIVSGRAYAEGWHIGTKLVAIDRDDTWPRYVRNRLTGEEPCCPASWFRPRES
jgi:Glycosyltransferase family 17